MPSKVFEPEFSEVYDYLKGLAEEEEDEFSTGDAITDLTVDMHRTSDFGMKRLFF